jgi:cyclase
MTTALRTYRRSSPLRLIARLDVKAPNLIKGVRLEGLRKIGDPNEHAIRYYQAGIDEIIYMDIVASLYERNSLLDIVEKASRDVFVPMTVGGGIRSVEDARMALRAGADKVAINTAAVRSPELISEMAEVFGSQAVVVSIEAMRRSGGGWEAFTDNGREHTGLDAVGWAMQAVERGAGELLVTSVDQEGTRKGFDLDLVTAISDGSRVPVIASGGLGTPRDAVACAQTSVDAIAVADFLHHNRGSLGELRDALAVAGFEVRVR